MKQKLMFLNVALALLCCAVGWRYRVIWQEAREREALVLHQTVAPEKPGVLPALSAYAPVIAMNYGDMVQKMLFARDRNPNIILAPAAPPPPDPMPPLPSYFGLMMGFGDPGIILRDKPGGTQHIYRAGDQVGDFKLLSFDNVRLKLKWKEETIERRLEDLVSKDNGQANSQMNAANAGPAAAAAAPPPVVNNITPTPQGPGKIELGNGSLSCAPNDSTPSGTVSNGFRKVAVSNPFGTSCRWDPVK